MTFVFMMLFSIGSGVIGPLLFGSALNIALGAAVGTVLGVVAWTLGTHATAQQEVAETVPA
jgi:putative effector of murein hydrolase